MNLNFWRVGDDWGMGGLSELAVMTGGQSQESKDWDWGHKFYGVPAGGSPQQSLPLISENGTEKKGRKWKNNKEQEKNKGN